MVEFPKHVEETVQALVEIHDEHHRKTPRIERFVVKAAARVAEPRFVLVVAIAFAVWIGASFFVSFSANATLGQPPLWLSEIASLLSVSITLLILISQRRENVWAHQRDQLTLELAMLSERKTAKIIQLLEELRRDHPGIADRLDAEAEAMSEPANAQAVGDALLAPGAARGESGRSP
jgi:uncharacterized membrane protein